MPIEEIEKIDPLLTKLRAEKETALNWQKRRHKQWNENYTLYRDFVKVSPLTQRQAVNVPIMKESVKTLLARIDEPPDIVFEDLGNDKEKEYVINELWKADFERLDFEALWKVI
jgi:hypothetical protein